MAVVLNLADWIERRKPDVGPYADYIISSVRAHEAEIGTLRELLEEYRDKTPLGHQPHMIAHRVDRALGRQITPTPKER